ncbi:MAG: hypothetical protein Q7T81_11500 [Pseudolabrys sp.]|nr:hypothetical protein [Pseudolabrys sp.]
MMRLVALAAACCIALTGVSAAETPAKKKAEPKLNADALRIPDSIHNTRAREIDRSGKALPPPSAPNKVDIGKYDLEFRAKSSSEINPRTGYDSGEKANLANTAIGRKGESGVPNYFGLKLSTPTD